MENLIVKDLMVAIDEYATISIGATLYEAVMALEDAQKRFDKDRHKHRAIIVFDEGNHISGKISQLDVIRGLEPGYKEIGNIKGISHTGFSPDFFKSMIEKYNLWQRPLDHICSKASEIRVEDVMYMPTEDEYVQESASLNEAMHQLVMGHHQSLLVMRGEEIVGVLRLTDVFEEVYQRMKTCVSFDN
ncbi:MAG: CBS domain-containing protein [Desulfatiglans sp.]|jgi:predicted transcriptional regulator|nr:CBS domain-containing protein [Thermodesulfobacteriota bacterium]MEE4353579.1 CBS domain-containing protein [Desulfatiglans sp.]